VLVCALISGSLGRRPGAQGSEPPELEAPRSPSAGLPLMGDHAGVQLLSAAFVPPLDAPPPVLSDAASEVNSTHPGVQKSSTIQKKKPVKHPCPCGYGLGAKGQCKRCDDGVFCEHKRRRSECKECHGASVCEHKRLRSNCKDCYGANVCEHKRQRSRCKECGGTSICEHQRIRSKCKECCPAKFARRSAADLDKLDLAKHPAWTLAKDKHLWTMKTDLWRECTNVPVVKRWKRIAEAIKMPEADVKQRWRLIDIGLGKLPV